MNQKVITDRKRIGTACEVCFDKLDKYNNTRNAYREQLRSITESPYNQEIQTHMRSKAEKAFGENVRMICGELQQQLNIMREAAEDMSAIVELDSDFQSTLSTVATLGKDLPPEVRLPLIIPFKGEMQLLKMLHAAYTAKDLSTSYFEELIYDVDARIDTFEESISVLAAPHEGTALRILDFGRALEKFAETEGAELKRRFSDFASAGESLYAAVRAAAGVGAAD